MNAVGATDIRAALGVLFSTPDELHELRVPNTPKRTASGYFDDLDALSRAAARLDRVASGVYVTLNPVLPALKARAANRTVEYARYTTADRDVTRRRWLPVDLDARRPAGISASDAEHDAALARSRAIHHWLREQGWPEPVLADSGNGAHLLFALDLPNDADALRLVSGSLAALDVLFSDGAVAVDLTTANAGRIWKLYGTSARKGENTPERPHRLSRLTHVPTTVGLVTAEQLALLSARRPQPLTKPGSNGSRLFNLDAWVSRSGLAVGAASPWSGGPRKWVLDCPWNREHRDACAFIVELHSGHIAAGCQHSSCAGRDWHALRDVVEPGWEGARASRALGASVQLQPPEIHSVATPAGPTERKPLFWRTAAEVAAATPERVAWVAKPWWRKEPLPNSRDRRRLPERPRSAST